VCARRELSALLAFSKESEAGGCCCCELRAAARSLPVRFYTTCRVCARGIISLGRLRASGFASKLYSEPAPPRACFHGNSRVVYIFYTHTHSYIRKPCVEITHTSNSCDFIALIQSQLVRSERDKPLGGRHAAMNTHTTPWLESRMS
jgi:hypothetical protein